MALVIFFVGFGGRSGMSVIRFAFLRVDSVDRWTRCFVIGDGLL
jgi:hypothetical protein